VGRGKDGAASQTVQPRRQAEKDINTGGLVGKVFYLLCPGRFRNILKLCQDRVVYVLPGKTNHRVLVDDKLVHFENFGFDPIAGVLPDLFGIGGMTSRRYANAIEEQLLEMI